MRARFPSARPISINLRQDSWVCARRTARVGTASIPRYISGGSSSGSAVAVAKGLVSFALGTDTAGSGRVPAAFNNIVGLKPSCGLLSTQRRRSRVPFARCRVHLRADSASDAAARARGRARVRCQRIPTRSSSRCNLRCRGIVAGSACRAPISSSSSVTREYRTLFELPARRLQCARGVRRRRSIFAPFLETARLLVRRPLGRRALCSDRGFLRSSTAAMRCIR